MALIREHSWTVLDEAYEVDVRALVRLKGHEVTLIVSQCTFSITEIEDLIKALRETVVVLHD